MNRLLWDIQNNLLDRRMLLSGQLAKHCKSIGPLEYGLVMVRIAWLKFLYELVESVNK